MPCPPKARSDKQREYVEYLVSQGLYINPKLEISIFNLKNGLPYVGLSTREDVAGGEVLIRVPEHLVLSSAKALQEA